MKIERDPPVPAGVPSMPWFSALELLPLVPEQEELELEPVSSSAPQGTDIAV